MKTTHTSRQMIKFLQLLESRGVTPDLFQQRLSHGILADIFDPNAVIPNRLEFQKLLQVGKIFPKPIPLSVDYGKTFNKMLDMGKYRHRNRDVNLENLPVRGEGVHWFEFDLIHPNSMIHPFDALTEIKKDSDPDNPWFPAQIEHILTFGASFPKIQKKYPIVGLGSSFESEGFNRFPRLGTYGKEREIGVEILVKSFDSSIRFLRVRRTSSPQSVN